MVAMPSSIKVGSHTYSIVRKPARQMKGSLGFCDFNDLQIWIKQKMRRSKSAEILLHEVLHAATYPSTNNETLRSDEEFVTAISPILLQVLQDNPILLRYLTES